MRLQIVDQDVGESGYHGVARDGEVTVRAGLCRFLLQPVTMTE